MPTYCGKDAGSRPEQLADLLKHPHRVPTFEHVQDRLDDWIKGYNAGEHCFDGASGAVPDLIMAQAPVRRVHPDRNVLDLMLQKWHRPVKVSKNGVRVVIKGKGLQYGRLSIDLKPHVGREVHIAYDPHDIRAVKVYDLKWRYITEAKVDGFNQFNGTVGETELKELIAAQRRYRKAKKTFADGRAFEYLTDYEQLADQQAARQPDPPSPDDPPQTMKLVQPKLQEAPDPQQLRKAAGAEHEDGDGEGREPLDLYRRDAHLIDGDDDRPFGTPPPERDMVIDFFKPTSLEELAEACKPQGDEEIETFDWGELGEGYEYGDTLRCLINSATDGPTSKEGNLS